MADVPTLTDGVVTLRGHRDDDLDALHEQSNDPFTVAWTSLPSPFTRADTERFVRDEIPAGWADNTLWCFAHEAEGRFAGTVLFRPQGGLVAEIGYDSAAWVRGTGHARRAVSLALDFAFGRGIHTVVWQACVGNWPSRKVAASLGFTIEGMRRAGVAQRGEMRDVWLGSLRYDDPRELRTPWLTVPRLEGDGIVLREMDERDIPRVIEACTDERSRHWLGGLPSPYTEETARLFLHTQKVKAATDEGVQWAIADPDDDRMLGTISLFDHVRGVEVEIGYWAHPDARGRGVMTRAVPLVTTWAFAQLGVAKVKIGAATGNTASLHVIETCGFRRYGVERLGTRLLEGRADLALYDVLAEEWAAR
jgi:RimJ/RimL family protein N-acetyltransferase